MGAKVDSDGPPRGPGGGIPWSQGPWDATCHPVETRAEEWERPVLAGEEDWGPHGPHPCCPHSSPPHPPPCLVPCSACFSGTSRLRTPLVVSCQLPHSSVHTGWWVGCIGLGWGGVGWWKDRKNGCWMDGRTDTLAEGRAEWTVGGRKAGERSRRDPSVQSCVHTAASCGLGHLSALWASVLISEMGSSQGLGEPRTERRLPREGKWDRDRTSQDELKEGGGSGPESEAGPGLPRP